MVIPTQVELHPSYSPHHLVEISTSPFHLTRRGWGATFFLLLRTPLHSFLSNIASINLDAGEFPLKLKIHFRHPEDRPLAMEHQVKHWKSSKLKTNNGPLSSWSWTRPTLACRHWEQNHVLRFAQSFIRSTQNWESESEFYDQLITEKVKVNFKISSKLRKWKWCIRKFQNWKGEIEF